jgi:uncharacterized protein
LADRHITSIRPLLGLLALVAALVSGAGALALFSPSARSSRTAARSIDSSPCTPAQPCLAIVVDDIGRDPMALRRLLALDAELTFAVLPHARHTAMSVAAIRARGRDLLLHLPMEPVDESKISDEPVLLRRARPIGAPLVDCLAAVPGAVAVNNHLGSALTQDRAAITEVLRQLAERALPFLDSRTSERSVACEAARTLELPCVERDVFLDDPRDRPSIERRFRAAVALARGRGWSVAIGHPHPTTIEALRSLLGSREIRVVGLSRVLRSASGRQGPSTRLHGVPSSRLSEHARTPNGPRTAHRKANSVAAAQLLSEQM